MLLCLIINCSAHLYSQHYTVQDFTQHLPVNKSTGDSVFIVKTGYPATGVLLKVDEKENFTGSFLVSGNDTLYFTEGEENPAGEDKKFSNLLTFSVPIRSFLFYPGRIQADIQFYYINAQQKDEGSTVKPSKKKRFGLCRSRHD